MILIHDSPGFRLGAKRITHPVTGTTIELYGKHPTARRPRWQRLVQLTLPEASIAALVTFLKAGGPS